MSISSCPSTTTKQLSRLDTQPHLTTRRRRASLGSKTPDLRPRTTVSALLHRTPLLRSPLFHRHRCCRRQGCPCRALRGAASGKREQGAVRPPLLPRDPPRVVSVWSIKRRRNCKGLERRSSGTRGWRVFQPSMHTSSYLLRSRSREQTRVRVVRAFRPFASKGHVFLEGTSMGHGPCFRYHQSDA